MTAESKNDQESEELLQDPISAKKWRIIEKGLFEWGKRYPGARPLVEDLLQRPGKPARKINWREDWDVHS